MILTVMLVLTAKVVLWFADLFLYFYIKRGLLLDVCIHFFEVDLEVES